MRQKKESTIKVGPDPKDSEKTEEIEERSLCMILAVMFYVDC